MARDGMGLMRRDKLKGRDGMGWDGMKRKGWKWRDGKGGIRWNVMGWDRRGIYRNLSSGGLLFLSRGKGKPSRFSTFNIR